MHSMSGTAHRCTMIDPISVGRGHMKVCDNAEPCLVKTKQKMQHFCLAGSQIRDSRSISSALVGSRREVNYLHSDNGTGDTWTGDDAYAAKRRISDSHTTRLSSQPALAHHFTTRPSKASHSGHLLPSLGRRNAISELFLAKYTCGSSQAASDKHECPRTRDAAQHPKHQQQPLERAHSCPVHLRRVLETWGNARAVLHLRGILMFRRSQAGTPNAISRT